MIIKGFEIKLLHGLYNYKIDFNEDLTFIYGENGCGKTTVLNILSYIVVGDLYKLNLYNFKYIKLYCLDYKSNFNILKISKKNDGEYSRITIKLNGNEVGQMGFSSDWLDPRNESNIYRIERVERELHENYNIQKLQNDKFKYVYIPVTRDSQKFLVLENDVRRRKIQSVRNRDMINSSYLNDSLHYVEDIIRNKYAAISSKMEDVNNKFRKNLLTSSLGVAANYDISKAIDSINDKNKLELVEKNYASYVETLKTLGEWDKNSQEKVDEFFKEYKESLREAQERDFGGVSLKYIFMSTEFERIQAIAQQAKNIEKEKEIIREPITKFLDTINNFFDIGSDKKVISIEEGMLVVRTKYPERCIPITRLSSGEKQLIIIFAYLIFVLSMEKSGVYVVDEPEVSLHIGWQKELVRSIRKLDLPVQLIFATHSPEIIGPYGEYSVELVKEVDAQVAKSMEAKYNDFKDC